MVAQPVNAPARQRAAFQSLARRIASRRPVVLSTLAHREAEAYRHCERLQEALALIDVQTTARRGAPSTRSCAKPTPCTPRRLRATPPRGRRRRSRGTRPSNSGRR